jgi:hypothetical protein
MSDEKSIIVRVSDWTSGTERITHPAQPVLVNATGGVQAAVQQVYPAFPGVCLRVIIIRGPQLLWHKHQPQWPSPEDSYTRVQDGDVVEIQLYARPAGPDFFGPGRPVPVEDTHERDHGLPPGPQESRRRLLTVLLRQLEGLY